MSKTENEAFSCCTVTYSSMTLCTPWTITHKDSLSFTISWVLLKLIPIESMMPSNQLILYCTLLLLPSVFCIKVFSSEAALRIRVKNIGASASASMNIQGCFPIGLTALFSLLLKGLNLLQHHRSKASILRPPLWSNSHIYT